MAYTSSWSKRKRPPKPNVPQKPKKREYMPEKYCLETQYYRGIPLKLILYKEDHFAYLKAKRFMIGDPKYNQNIWIPNRYLDETGKLLPNVNLDWKMREAYHDKKFYYAHISINPYTWREEPWDKNW